MLAPSSNTMTLTGPCWQIDISMATVLTGTAAIDGLTLPFR